MPPGAKPIIATAYATEKSVRRAFDLGVYDFLEKSGAFEHLLRAKVRNAIEIVRERNLGNLRGNEAEQRIAATWSALALEQEPNRKGLLLDELLVLLFRSIDGFQGVSTHRKSKDEEIDLVIRKELHDRSIVDANGGSHRGAAHVLMAGTPMRLTDEQRASFERNGFLVLEGFVPRDRCDALRQRAGELVAAFEPGEHPSIFTTHEQRRRTDDYFLASGDKIRFFFEDEALDDAGHLRQPKARAINKIGHALHDLDPVFERFSRDRALAEVAADLGFQDPRLLQSMYICKPPFVGGEVLCHQEATFLYTEPQSTVGLWFAIDDATLGNGCLWVIPGGHRQGVRSRFMRDGNGGTRFEELDATPWDLDARVPLEAPAGTMVILHGMLPHMSDANRSAQPRHAYALHLIEGCAHYPDWNWLQRPPHMPARGF